MVLCSALLSAGCANRPSTPATRTWELPCDTCIVGVENFGKVSPLLWRGAQPTEEGFRNLEEAGVKTVIDLREDHDDFDDYAKLGGAQLKYQRVPMHPWDPDRAQIIVLMKLLERTLKDPASTPVFVHCSQGRDRTGYSIATYRMLFDGWNSNDAILEMFDFRFNAIWFHNPTFLKKLDIATVKELMHRAP